MATPTRLDYGDRENGGERRTETDAARAEVEERSVAASEVAALSPTSTVSALAAKN